MPVEVSFSLKDGESAQRFCPLWMHRAATCLVPAPKIITDELIHEIGRTEGLRVSAASSIAPLVAEIAGNHDVLRARRRHHGSRSIRRAAFARNPHDRGSASEESCA
jgi:hypothetical protein